MSLRIALADLNDPQVHAIIAAHRAHSLGTCPPESVFSLDADGLAGDSVDLFAAHDGDTLIGCGALRRLGGAAGELKSMHVLVAHRGKGHARVILDHLLDHAQTLGLAELFLETGSMAAYAPARALYARAGFRECPRFGDYPADPNSFYMSRKI